MSLVLILPASTLKKSPVSFDKINLEDPGIRKDAGILFLSPISRLESSP